MKETTIQTVAVEKFKAIIESKMGKPVTQSDVAVIYDEKPAFNVSSVESSDFASYAKNLADQFGLDLSDVAVVTADKLEQDPEAKVTKKFKK